MRYIRHYLLETNDSIHKTLFVGDSKRLFIVGVPNLWYAEAFLVVREMFFQKCKKNCFHRNSHPEKCRNMNLAPVHFRLLLNCSTYTVNIYIYVRCSILLRGLDSSIGAFFSFYSVSAAAASCNKIKYSSQRVTQYLR